jgi:hypothetical protein
MFLLREFIDKVHAQLYAYQANSKEENQQRPFIG